MTESTTLAYYLGAYGPTIRIDTHALEDLKAVRALFGRLASGDVAQTDIAKVLACGTTDPLARIAGFEPGAAGRVLRQVLPDSEAVGLSYDPSGNLASVTPLARPAHAFQYTPVDLLQEYAPPVLGSEEARTRYEHNRDRQLRQVIRPDRRAVDLD